MSYLDRSYIAKISHRLESFKKKKDSLYNCRCPICGDSQSNKTKARGFFYESKDGSFLYKCHNCGVGRNVGSFLRELFPDVYQEYKLDKFRDQSRDSLDSIETEKEVVETVRVEKLNLPNILSLDKTHPAVEYVSKRMIPRKFWDEIYYTEDYAECVSSILGEDKYELRAGDKRLVFPFYDTSKQIIALQGRTLDPRNKIRYLTIKIKQNSPKLFGMDRVDDSRPIYVTEGPIDSLFVPNGIAMAGSDISEIPYRTNLCTFIFDNEPRSGDTNKKMQNYVAKGFKIVVWPRKIESKDINDMILSGELKVNEMLPFLRNNTYSGLLARTRIAEWSKI